MSPPVRLLLALGVLTGVTAAGAGAYVLVEGWHPLDALYMSLITVSTVGFGEVLPLSTGGRIVTMVLIMVGVAAFALVFGTVIRLVTEGELQRHLGSMKLDAKIATLENHVILCGAMPVTTVIAEGLSEAGSPFVIIDRTEETARALARRGWAAIHGDATDEEVLVGAGLRVASAVVPALRSDADNVFISLIARSENPAARVIACCEHESTRGLLNRAGVQQVVLPQNTAAAQVLGLLRHSSEALRDVEETAAAFAEYGVTPTVLTAEAPGTVLELLSSHKEIEVERVTVLALTCASGVVQRPTLRHEVVPGDQVLLVVHAAPVETG